jgi:hypothetical protein
MTYYILGCDGPYPTMPISATDETDEIIGPWIDGQLLTKFVLADIHGPITYEFGLPVSREAENLKALYTSESIPLMRDDLVEALQVAGVSNLELFPASITNPETGEVFSNYKAFNLVGLVACADESKSTLMGTTEFRKLDTDFDGLVIDEAKANGLLMFRVAECVTAIAIHESVKQKIEERGIPGMVFYGPGEWAG